MIEELLIHIGYNKTGSTWLQRELFISENNLFEPLSLKKSKKSTLAWSFVVGSDNYLLTPFTKNKDVIKQKIVEILNVKKGVRNKLFVLSSERLAGDYSNGGIDSNIIADRLKYFFPNAKILIVIREQKSFILAAYYQYLSPIGVGVLGLKKFLNAKFDSFPYFSPHHIDYIPLVKEYMKLFGKENVLVLPFEEFQNHPKGFIQKISQFLNQEIIIDDSRFNVFHNKKRNHFVLYVFRFLNYFILSKSTNNYSALHNKYTRFVARGLQICLMKLTPQVLNNRIKNKHEKYIEKWVAQRYVHSNVQLSKLIGIDLSKYGYH